MKIKPQTYICNSDEYIITPEHPFAKDYKITFQGKEIRDVIAIIRKNLK